MPRTMSAEREKQLFIAAGFWEPLHHADGFDEVRTELEAERAVSKALAEALGHVFAVLEDRDRWLLDDTVDPERDTRMMNARAALAQYAALEPPILASPSEMCEWCNDEMRCHLRKGHSGQHSYVTLASSEGLPADASPSQGGRDS